MLVVTTGTTSVTISGAVTATTPDGETITIPVGPITVGANETVTISVCTTADAPEAPVFRGCLPGCRIFPGSPLNIQNGRIQRHH